MTLNGQYGFQSTDTNGGAEDSLTGGPYNVTVAGNEISYNDTCDYSGLLQQLGNRLVKPSTRYPRRIRNRTVARVAPDGDQGGFKLWQTNGRDNKRQLHPQKLGPRRLGRHRQRQHDVDRQHDHRITRARRSSRRSLTTSPSAAITWPTTTGSTG